MSPRATSATGSIGIQTGAQAVLADAADPSRRPDVLLRVRRDHDNPVSVWWMIGAFVGVSAAVIALLSFVPGGH